MQQYIERNFRSKTEIFDDASRKRAHPEATNGLDSAKRQKLSLQNAAPLVTVPKIHIPLLAPGQKHSIAELFTVTNDEALKNFDVAMLGEDMVVKIGISILQKVNHETLDQTIDVSQIKVHPKLNANEA